jgi:Metallopeptidase toxin 3
MNMTASERVFAPEMEKYLRDSFSKLADNSKIVNNLMGCGNMKQQQARNALRWETDPFVFIQTPSNRKCANFVGNVKCAFDAASNSIEVDDTWFENFLTNGGLLPISKGGLVPGIGVALLHALCHWGNFNAKVTEKKEMGFEFEPVKGVSGRMIRIGVECSAGAIMP